MRTLKRRLLKFSVVLFLGIWLVGCGPTVVVKRPPPARTEVRPAKPYTNAVWVKGHWKWSGGRYVWVSGYWLKSRPGKTWVAGHWAQRGRGWVWVKGHWR